MIIGLSGKKQSGKSSSALYLQNALRFVEVSWAFPLKEIIGKELLGLNNEQMYGSEAAKEAIIPKWGKSARQLLQEVGTDCFRNIIHPNFWVIVGMGRITEQTLMGNNVVVSDCRFLNEMDAIKKLGGISLRVERIGQVSTDTHRSEVDLDYYNFDYTIKAESGDLKSLYRQLDEIVNANKTK